MKAFSEVLYKPFLSTIRGSYYGVINQDILDEECFNLARRAIAAFKFPKKSLAYEVYYGIRQEDGSLIYTKENGEPIVETDDSAIPFARFISNDVDYAEFEIIIAWMKVYWCENQISNADNFDDMYTDVNIKTFSRANAVDKNTKLMAEYRKYARDLENRYSRIQYEDGMNISALGNINSDE